MASFFNKCPKWSDISRYYNNIEDITMDDNRIPTWKSILFTESPTKSISYEAPTIICTCSMTLFASTTFSGYALQVNLGSPTLMYQNTGMIKYLTKVYITVTIPESVRYLSLNGTPTIKIATAPNNDTYDLNIYLTIKTPNSTLGDFTINDRTLSWKGVTSYKVTLNNLVFDLRDGITIDDSSIVSITK